MGISTTLYYLTIVVFILSLIAQLRVTSTFRKYSKTICKSGLTGCDLAIALLNPTGKNVRNGEELLFLITWEKS